MKPSVFLKKLKTLNYDSLVSIKGIGEVLALNFVEFLESERFKTLISEFEALESDDQSPEIVVSKPVSEYSSRLLPLATYTIVITGSFDESRDLIKEKLEKLGAKIASSVTGSTTHLLAGKDPGSKVDKALQKGIPIINDVNFFLDQSLKV